MGVDKIANIRLASVLVAALLAVPVWSSGSPGGQPRALEKGFVFLEEWTDKSYNSHAGMLFNDTNHDGCQEMVVYGWSVNSWKVTIYETGEYHPLWNGNYTSDRLTVKFLDTGGNGTSQILITQTWNNRFCLTAVSGSTFETIWNSPAFCDSYCYVYPPSLELADVDADNVNELCFINSSVENRSGTYVYDWRLHIFSLRDLQEEWELRLSDPYKMNPRWVELDSDPALELLLRRTDYTDYYYKIYDGATHEPQWNRTFDYDPDIEHIGDLDGDSQIELAMSYYEYDPSTEAPSITCWVFAGSTGEPEWNLSFEATEAYTDFSVADINGDGIQELLVQSREEGDWDQGCINITHCVLELKGHTEIWRHGPFMFNRSGPGHSYLFAQDLTGDGIPELVVANYTWDRSNLTAIDGHTFNEIWRSPDFGRWGSGSRWARDIDDDGIGEMVQKEVWQDNDSHTHSMLRIYRTDTFEEVWTSQVFNGSELKVGTVQAVNDSRPELLVSEEIGQYYLFDTTTFYPLWKSQGKPTSTPVFADMSGDGLNEILAPVDNHTYGPLQSLTMYNGTTFKEFWNSPEIEGTLEIVTACDIDGDSRCEVAVAYHYSTYSRIAITVWEAYEGYPPTPDAALSTGDLSLSVDPVYDGMRILLNAEMHNLGDTEFKGGRIAFFIDGMEAGYRQAYVNRRSSVVVSISWLATGGEHQLTVLADPANNILEWNESNNNATMDFTVLPAPPPSASIIAPWENEVFDEDQEITFIGTSGLPPEMENVSYEWVSNLSGSLGSAPIFGTTLYAGRHQICLHVFNHGLVSNATVNICVLPPNSIYGPAADITSPSNGARFLPDEPIFFDGTKSYPGERMFRLTYYWSSDLLGPFSTEASFERALPVGVHNITLTVDDGHEGRSSMTIKITVWDPSVVVARISLPYEGQTFEENRTVQFDATGTYSSPERPLSFAWSSNVSGSLGSGERFEAKLPPGRYLIILNVSDDRDHHGTAAVNISILAAFSHPPSVSISFPTERAVVNGTVVVSGRALDALKVLAVDIRIDDGPWLATTGTDNWTYAWNTSRVANGRHRITVRATDGSFASPDVSINVTVSNPKTGKTDRPPSPGLHPWMIAAITGAFLAAAAGLFVFLARKRSRAKAIGPAAHQRRPTSKP